LIKNHASRYSTSWVDSSVISKSWGDELVIESSSAPGITILGPDAQTGRLLWGSPTDNYLAQVGMTQSTGLMQIGTKTAGGEVALETADGVEAVRIDNNGNVGIGDTTPSQKLDVLGSIRLGTAGAGNVLGTSAAAAPTGLLYWGDREVCDDTGNCGTAGMPSGTSGQTIRHNGSDWIATNSLYNNGVNVGIGTTSLTSKLNIDGDIELTTNGQFEKVMNSNFAVIDYPEGAFYQTTTNAVTGAIEITLPVLGPTDMMKMTVDVYDYTTDESVTLIISGYNYSSTNWANTSVQIIGSKTDRAYTVRFGHDGVNSKIWIGELGSTWSYPQVVVREVMLGFLSQLSDWQGAWDIDFEATTFDTIVNTQSGSENFPQASNSDTLDDISSDSFLRSDTSDSYTSGTLAFNSGTTLAVASGSTLDVNGNLSIADTDIALDGATANLNSTGNFSINTNDLFVNKSNGHIGIGTTSPASALTLDTAVNHTIPQFAINFNPANPGCAGCQNIAQKISVTDSAGSSKTNIGLWINSTGAATNYAAIFENGNVGVGSTAPAYKLDVNGDIKIENGSDLYTYSGASYSPSLGNRTYTEDNYVADAQTLSASVDALDQAVYDIATGGGTGLWTDAGTITHLTSTVDDFAIGGTSSTAPFFFDEGAGRLSLNTNGSGGGLVLGADTQLYRSDANVLRTPDSMVVDGNVGIGTTAPGSPLDMVPTM